MKEQLVRKIASAYNTLDASIFTDLLMDDFTYESQHVFEPMNGKENFLTYITGKFNSVKESGNLVYAELGFFEKSPCIIISQGEKENKGALLFIELDKETNKLTRMDMCGVAPNWREAQRTHEYPGLKNN